MGMISKFDPNETHIYLVQTIYTTGPRVNFPQPNLSVLKVIYILELICIYICVCV